MKVLPEDYSYRPLPDSLTIKESKIEGIGLHCVKFIPKDTDLGISHHKIFNTLIRTPISGFLNASLDPNCIIMEEVDTTYHLITIRNIMPGEELTVDYHNSPCAKRIIHI